MTEFERGPAEFVVVRFSTGAPTGAVAQTVAELVADGTIALLDLVFVARPSADELEVIEWGDLGFDHPSIRDIHVTGLTAVEDLEHIAPQIPVGQSAAVLVIEHVWARELHSRLFHAGAEIVVSERIPSAVIEALSAHSAVTQN